MTKAKPSAQAAQEADRPRGSRKRAGAATIADVARVAGCSPMTVSRVINGQANVSAQTRQRVEQAIDRLSFAPNSAARSLAGAGQVRLALLFDNPSSSYLAEFLMGALEEAARRDVQLVVQSCADPAQAGAQVRHLAESGIAGFILPAPLCEDQALLDLMTELGAIAVAVGPGEARASHPAVQIDEFQAAFDMTRHIIALGHRRIGFILGNPAQAAAGRRLAGFRAAMEQAGLPCDDALIAQGQFTYRSGLAAAEALLAAGNRPTAIFASNDDMAAATVAVAHRLHLAVPEDLTVCGFDDTDMARSTWPELTTVRQPIRQMTAWAVEAASRMIRAQRAGEPIDPTPQILPYELVRRESDAPPPAET